MPDKRPTVGEFAYTPADEQVQIQEVGDKLNTDEWNVRVGVKWVLVKWTSNRWEVTGDAT